jgi:hypothetical protein
MSQPTTSTPPPYKKSVFDKFKNIFKPSTLSEDKKLNNDVTMEKTESTEKQNTLEKITSEPNKKQEIYENNQLSNYVANPQFKHYIRGLNIDNVVLEKEFENYLKNNIPTNQFLRIYVEDKTTNMTPKYIIDLLDKYYGGKRSRKSRKNKKRVRKTQRRNKRSTRKH